jgi:cytochrome c-type biogenesis protein CcmH
MAIAAVIDDLVAQAGVAPDEPTPGPSQAEVEAAGEMSAGDRRAMIEGMVARLGERLATEGGPPADWAQMIRSLGVLGRKDEAARIRDEGLAVFAGNPAALSEIATAAAEAGLGE